MRNEIKFCSDYETLKQIIIKKRLRRLHQSRIVNSIYFDTVDLSDFVDSEEGSVPRKKTRFRWYGKSNLLPNVYTGQLEVKHTYALERDKEIIDLSGLDFDVLKGIIDNKFSVSHYPIVWVSYSREYFISPDGKKRYTLDSQLKYRRMNARNKVIGTYVDPTNVLELKVHVDVDYSRETNELSDLRSRFSKYCEAITKLKIA